MMTDLQVDVQAEDVRHLLVIPVAGLAQMIHSEHPLDAKQLLTDSLDDDATAITVGLSFEVNSHPGGSVYYLTGAGQTPNLRAMDALNALIGTAVMLCGLVIFAGLSEDDTIRVLSLI